MPFIVSGRDAAGRAENPAQVRQRSFESTNGRVGLATRELRCEDTISPCARVTCLLE